MWSKVVLILVYFILSGANGATLPECESGGVRCGNGTCIHMKMLCDGVSQCPRGEDERGCEKTCSTGYYQCYSSSCIPNYKVCDGNVDCYYGDDEDNCYRYSTTTTTRDRSETTDSCSSSQFQCNSGYCIPGSYVCDGYNDCSYGEDEIGCQSNSVSVYTTTTRCNGFQCWNGECIPWYYVCNGYIECSSGEDEYSCSSSSRTTHHTTTTGTPSVCNNPYELVGNRCVFVDPVTTATWNEARYVCERFGGDLVILDSVQFFGDIIQHINENGLTARDYWVGGTNAGGNWKWLDGSSVTMGTPFWAIYGYGSNTYEQEPRGSSKYMGTFYYSTTANPSSKDCTFLDKNRFYYVDDNDCDQMKAFICQVPTWQTSAKSPSEIPTIKEIGEERLKEILASSKLEKQ